MKNDNGLLHGNIRWYLMLHIALFVSACAGLFGKSASRHDALTPKWILFYGCMLASLGIYAILWQQILKVLPVTFAYTHKAVTVVWGMLLGHIVFQEVIAPKQLLGAAVVIFGCILYTRAEGKEDA